MKFAFLKDIYTYDNIQDFFITLKDITLQNLNFYIASFVVLVFSYIWFWFAKGSRKIRLGFVIFATLVHAIYLFWRIGFTLPTVSLISFVLGAILVSAEVLGFSQALVYRKLFSTQKRINTEEYCPLDYYPTVDIMITTYKEPEIVLKRTVACATQLDYPLEKLNVYVCDDGSRQEICELCKEYGVHWITRQEHEDAKAGNLNNCYINYSSGDFSVILDADMAVRSDFLEKTLGYFRDEEIAFVQTPQVFFNQDVFQRNLGFEEKIPNEQDFFMQEIQKCRQEYNALLFVGSGCVFRRTHLEEIGFIPTGSITEDMATSLLLQNAGYKGVLTNDTFAKGLAAESFGDYVVQRTRWCQGNIEVLKIWNPWKMKNLSLAQKVIITDGVSFWFFGLQKMVYILAPLIFVILGIPIMITYPVYLLLFWLPSFVLNDLTMQVFSHKFRTSSWSHIYETALAPHLTISALRALLLDKKRTFKATPKGEKHDNTYFAFKYAKPHLVLLGLSIIALAIVIFKISTTNSIQTLLVYLLNGFWILFNLIAIVSSVGICFERPRVRKYDRIAIDFDIPINFSDNEDHIGRLKNISEGGCKIIPKEIENPLGFVDKNISINIGGENISGKVLRYIPGQKAYAVEFDNMTKQTYDKLVRFIFANENAGFGFLKDRRALKSLFVRAFDSARVRIIKKIYQFKNGGQHIFRAMHVITKEERQTLSNAEQLRYKPFYSGAHLATG